MVRTVAAVGALMLAGCVPGREGPQGEKGEQGPPGAVDATQFIQNGTAPQSASFNVTGSATVQSLAVSGAANVGDSATVSGSLSVAGQSAFGGTAQQDVRVTIRSGAAGMGTVDFVPSTGQSSHAHHGDDASWYLRSGDPAGRIVLQDTGGTVGIGVEFPTERLEVNGHIVGYANVVARGNVIASGGYQYTCSSGFVWAGNNHCYRYFTSPLTTWGGAENACRAWGGHLMSLTSRAEFEAVKGAIGDATGYWIGLTDQYSDTEFIWTDATPFAAGLYAFWGTGQPETSTTQNCVFVLSGGWHDAPCSELRAYICEKGL